MTGQQQIFALITGGLIFLVIVELVRRRKLKEEYTWLWLITGLVIFFLVVWYDFLRFVTRAIGARIETSALFIFGLLFLILINLWFSVKISSIQDQMKNLIQEMAILKKEKGKTPTKSGQGKNLPAGRQGKTKTKKRKK